MKRFLPLMLVLPLLLVANSAHSSERYPTGLLWTPPIASQNSPRMDIRFFDLDGLAADASIGGTLPLVRFDHPSTTQLDLVAVVKTRFANDFSLTVADYTLELPVSVKRGDWVFRAAFSHTSSHLGDDYLKGAGVETTTTEREEFALGASRVFGGTRVYGQAALAFGSEALDGESKQRVNAGAEWTRPGDGPFAAVDVDARAWQDWNANVTIQAGWQWRAENGRKLRLAAEYYNGRAPYMQIDDQEEDHAGLVLAFDW